MARQASKDAHRSRTEQERARVYAARTAWHAGQIRRRVRDNTIAGIVTGLLIAGAIASQAVHAQVTAPEPAQTEDSTPLQNPFSTLFPTP